MANAVANCSSKIRFKHQQIQKEILITTVYARCTTLDRLELWEDLEEQSCNANAPWLVGGDFNVIMDSSEKLGGIPVTQNETVDFAQCINSCALTELKFTRSKYTWWNGRIEEDCIFKRLDRVFGNTEFIQHFLVSEVQHLIREGSDHAPLQLRRSGKEIRGSPFYIVNEKMKALKKALTKWSKETHGNIFLKMSTMEDIVKVKEVQFEINNLERNKKELVNAEEEIRKFY
ncbi:hypothetical protein KY290_017448 [Solanum tuberosum]|uniref:Endonuclease/exonuclease/phosphatase domain-containing protein n=1 Tax=Solanum tuberosum TaxID=4113 RepID=A0ABQ7VBB5_SOLTU|nr:hypothetical protein KY290_017448 [Solanum tuberosum]